MSRNSISLFLRPHTAKCVRAWCADPSTGLVKVSNAKVFGAMVYSQIKAVRNPVKTIYRKDFTEKVDVQLTVRYDKNKSLDWRGWTMHIDRPSMIRIDRWINDLFILIIYQHYVGAGRDNKAEVIRAYLEKFDINEDDLMWTTVYDTIRRQEREELKNDRWYLLNSLR